jgi:hypothetical protein
MQSTSTKAEIEPTAATTLSARPLGLVAVLTPVSPSAALKVSRNLMNVTMDAMVAADTRRATAAELMRLTNRARSKRRESTMETHVTIVRSDAAMYATATKVETAA